MMALNLALVREHERISIPPMDGLVASMKKGGKTFKEAGGEDAYFGDPGAATIEDGENILEKIADQYGETPAADEARLLLTG